MSDENTIDRAPILIAFLACGLSGLFIGVLLMVVVFLGVIL